MKISWHFIFAFIFALPPTEARSQDQSARPASSADVDDILSTLPPIHEGSKRLYLLEDAHLKMAKTKIDAAKAHGDIIGAIIARLEALKPGTERDEATMYQLVKLLEQYPDQRSVALMERLQNVAPKNHLYGDEGEWISLYDFREAARLAGGHIRAELSAQEWEKSLKGIPPKERVKRLADAMWLNDIGTASLDRAGATQILRRECPIKNSCGLNALLERIGDIDASTDEGKSRLIYAMQNLEIAYQAGSRDARIKSALNNIRSKYAKQHIADYAESYLERISKMDGQK